MDSARLLREAAASGEVTGMEAEYGVMLETPESIIANAEELWSRGAKKRPVVTQAEAGARIQEIADRCIPVYTSDLLRLALRDTELATTEPSLDGVLERHMTAASLIARNMYDAVSDRLWQVYYAEVARDGRRNAA
ncbi:MAG: hypothetical protein O3C10_03585 [Chloroflexi bacterium]|nr:hypothetical protein [Chloroflexota bacterium]